ncbi:arylsulfatase B-like [Babylonia areolata]|uniref:arylsulfatase B-like n=1 Tax=Babylonia areolata TaxID=304850 RepID=UPI003FD5B906
MTSYTMLVTSAVLMTTCLLGAWGVEGNKIKERGPNFLFVLMDDMGWNDLGVHDPNMVTPTLDRLYNEGFRLNFSYADPLGSSSRASLFSGKFSFRMGLQDGAIHKYSSAHVPVDEVLMPEALRRLGYFTHLIGKWNQGFCNVNHTPTERGFQTFFGQYTEGTNHRTMKTEEGFYDVHYGNEPMRDPSFTGKYSTEMWTKMAVKMIKRHKGRYPPNSLNPFFIMLSLTAIRAPNDVPDKYLRKCRKSVFTSEDRRQKCGMMAAVDLGLARVLKALNQTGLDEDTIVFFTSDNGGDVQHGSSNWPLRGSKGTVWEGGIRVPSFIWSKSRSMLPVQNYTYAGMFHAVDWLPTMLGFALKVGRPKVPLQYGPPMDGRNHWRLIKNGAMKSFRVKFGYLVNETDKQVAYIRDGDFKLVAKEEGFPGWYAPPPSVNASGLEEPTLNYKRRPFLLYNVRQDPNETRDLSRSKVPKNAEARQKLLLLWDRYNRRYVTKQTDVVDSSPANHPEHNNVWSPGTC